MSWRVWCLVFAWVACAPALWAEPSVEADRAWQTIMQQAEGPGTRFHDQKEAFAAAGKHLDTQEAALREFVRVHPEDPRAFSARIRLSSVLSARGRLTHQPALMAEAQKGLSDIEADPQSPLPVKADAGFARVSHSMEDMNGHPLDASARDGLLKAVRAFDAAYPGDRRTAGLLTEAATIYDADPAQKKALLEEAAARATDEALRGRIGDDLKRLGLLGHPLELRLLPWQGGAPISLGAARGRVSVVLFWASSSLPSLRELARLKEVAAGFQGQPVDFYGVSLDEDRAALAATIKAADIRWPVQCDGRGWKGEMVRSLGINAVPTVWVLDRRGELTTLNARENTADSIHAALDAK